MIITWSSGAPLDHMDESILLDLAPQVARHPWWTARARLTIALLERLGVWPPSAVLDAGCGWGVTLKSLERRGFRATGLDVSRAMLEVLDAADHKVVEADLTQPWPRGAPTYDAILALDVIEHLDDDAAAVARLAERLNPGGVLVVSVPALPELYGEFDAIQGHRRRYTPGILRAAFAGSGLAIDRVFWWGEWLVNRLRRSRSRLRSHPGESPSRTYGRYLKLPPWPAPILLRAMFAREQSKALDGRLKIGTSLFAVGRKAT